MTMKISNAFEKTTQKGKKVFRINIDNNEILSHLEQGNTHIAIDILTEKGQPKTFSGRSKFGNYRALMYYIWATPAKQEAKTNG